MDSKELGRMVVLKICMIYGAFNFGLLFFPFSYFYSHVSRVVRILLEESFTCDSEGCVHECVCGCARVHVCVRVCVKE